MTRWLLAIASRVVPRVRRDEWLERWEAELWAFDDSPKGSGPHPGRLRFVLGAFPDALTESFDGWREGWSLAGLMADVRDGWRSIRHAPAAAATVVVIIGVGTTSAATIFSLIDATLLRPPRGLGSPEALVQIGRHDSMRFDSFSYPNYRDLSEALADVVDLVGYTNMSVVIGEGLDAEVAPAQGVTTDYFRVLQVPLTGGAGFTPGDDVGDRAQVVVSQSYWRLHSAAIEARGGTLAVNGRLLRVVGVAPDRFVGLDVGRARPELWVPLSLARRSGDDRRFEQRDHSWIWTVGRRRPGVGFVAARDAVVAAHARLADPENPAMGATITVVDGVGFRPADQAEAEQVLGTLLGIASLVLLVAVSNASSVQFARALGRRRELAVRLALGATPFRVLRGLVVEQSLVAILGAGTAFVLTFWTTGWLAVALPYDIAASFGPDIRLLLFAIGAAVVTGTSVALWPLWSATRTALRSGIGPRAATRSTRRVATLLVATQLALSTVLLVAGGLLLRSAARASEVRPGFAIDDVLVATVRVQPGRVVDRVSLVADIKNRLAAVPGVLAVGAATSLPVVEPQSSLGILSEEDEGDPDGRRRRAVATRADRGFFDVLRLPAPAAFGNARGGEGVEPVLVSESLGQLLRSDGDVVGLRLNGGQLRIEGVTTSIAMRSLRDNSAPAVWLPLDPTTEMPAHFVLRTGMAPENALEPVRTALLPLGADLMVRQISPLAPLVAASMGETITVAGLAAVFGIIALAMALLGLYSVIASQVMTRRQEFGVKLALGARPQQIVRGVLASAAMISAIGCLVGFVLVWLAEGQLRPFLFEVNVRDPLVIAIALVVLAGTTLLAALGPATRAARTDPLVVIRSE